LQRVLSTTALLGLLIATAAAFAITEHLKLVKSPIYGTAVSKRLSPVCDCATRSARISVKLRHGDSVTVSILDASRQPVRILVVGKSVPRGTAVFHWGGAADAGGLAPDGVYHVQFHLAKAHRTILLPNPIVLDTHPPQVESVKTGLAAFSPDGDGRGDVERIHYRFDSPAHAVVYLYGQRVLGPTWAHGVRGTVAWHGRAGGERLPAGTYVLWLGGVDLAGNETPAADRRPVIVQIRYIRLTRKQIVARARSIAAIGVVTDARAYTWRLAGRTGTATGDVFRFRVPSKPGRYTLRVAEHGHHASAVVVVRKR
jgi:hypothetical protein